MYYEYVKDDINKYIDKCGESKMGEIIKHSLTGGKCIRAYIVKHVIKTLSNDKINVWEPIASVEVIHAASLIIDDLPCMDNSLVRRKKKATFVKFGERQAILTAMFMCSDSLGILLKAVKKTHKDFETHQANLVHKLVTEWNGLIGGNLVVGQMLDLKEDVKKHLNLDVPVGNDKLITMIYKTSSIFILSFILGAIYSQKKNLDYNKFKVMGFNFGIMFQIMDDFCDLEEDAEIDSTNYVLSNGINESLIVYIDKKREMISLLKDNSLFTKEMIQLIKDIDEKIVLKLVSLFSEPMYKKKIDKKCIHLLKNLAKF